MWTHTFLIGLHPILSKTCSNNSQDTIYTNIYEFISINNSIASGYLEATVKYFSGVYLIPGKKTHLHNKELKKNPYATSLFFSCGN